MIGKTQLFVALLLSVVALALGESKQDVGEKRTEILANKCGCFDC